MELFFVRHGEHGGEGAILTEQGKGEMFEVGENISPNNTVVVFHPPGERFVESAQVILGEQDSEYKRKEVRQLSYMKMDTSTPYYKNLIDSIRAKRCLEFHILHSDDYIKESGVHISSYTTMSALTSRLLLKYIDIQNRLREDRMVDIQRVFCAREFVWACFRSKIIEIKNGRDEMFRYVEWYTNTQEGNPDARKSVARVFFGDPYENGVIKISDIYGDEEFSISELNLILQQEQELLEIASIKA